MPSVHEEHDPEAISRSNSSSSRRHVVLGEASELISLNTLHRTSLEHERDATTDAYHVENDVETPSTSHTSLEPNSVCEAKVAQATSPHRAARWKCVSVIIGFLFAALLSALGHYLLVRNLNGTLTESSYLSQSQVSAISILLTTIFKAALTASIGTCFAQHLWFVLSGDATSLLTIDRLFVYRTNILALGHLRSIWRAPLLFIMAFVVWCLGFATIYPPGALVVTFQAHNFTQNYNISIMNPPVPKDLDLAGNDTFPILGGIGLMTLNANTPAEQRLFMYSGPKLSLINVAQSIVTIDQVFSMPAHPGENSSYRLQFRGPQLRCELSKYNSSIPLEFRTIDTLRERTHALTALVFESEWDQETLSYSVTQHHIDNYTIQRNSNNITGYQAMVNTIKQSCRSVSVLYDVEIYFPRGVQTIRHSFSHEMELLKKKQVFVNDPTYQGYPSNWLLLPPGSQGLQNWHQKILTALPISNEWALLDALGSMLTGEFYEDSPAGDPTDPSFCATRSDPSNDTAIYDCPHWAFIQPWYPANYSAPLKGTVFQTARFQGQSHLDESGFFDPRSALNITEDLLNDVLTNITLSAMSLGLWWDMVPVTITRYSSKYSFANPLNLILPYSICLAATAIFASIAIWSLWQNGVPVADGGFLQIMIATRGNREMDRLLLQERLSAIDDMSEELKNLKVRYGELVTEETLGVERRHLGFGTAEETLSLRRRKMKI